MKGNFMLKLNPKIVKPLDHLFILQPVSFFAIWVFVALGSGAGQFFAGQGVWWLDAVAWLAVLKVGLLTIVLGIAHYFEKYGFVPGTVALWKESQLAYKNPRRTATLLWSIAGLCLLGIFIMDFLAGAIAILLFLLNGYLLGTATFRKINNFWVRLLVASISGYGLFLFGWQISTGLQTKALLYGLPYLLGWLAVYLLTTLYSDSELLQRDETEDGPSNPNRILIGLIVAIYGLAFAGGVIARDPVISVAAMLASPLFIILIFRPSMIWVVRTARYVFLFITLVICVEYPWLFAFLLVHYYVWKFYYFNRWGVNFPTFQV